VLDESGAADIRGKTVNDAPADLAVRHLPAAEHQGYLNLIAFFQKFQEVLELNAIVMIFNVGLDPDLFYLKMFLVFLGFALPLLLLIFIFAEVHDAADRRLDLWGNLNKIKLIFSREVKACFQRDDAQLLAVRADNPKFRNTDLFVDSDKFFNAPPP